MKAGELVVGGSDGSGCLAGHAAGLLVDAHDGSLGAEAVTQAGALGAHENDSFDDKEVIVQPPRPPCFCQKLDVLDGFVFDVRFGVSFQIATGASA